MTSDRWWAYDHLPLARRQVCWSHLQRDFQAHAEGSGAEQELGQAGLALCERVFWAWEVYQHTHDRRELQRTIARLRRELKPILASTAAKHPATNAAAASPATCSKPGPPSGPSPPAPA